MKRTMLTTILSVLLALCLVCLAACGTKTTTDNAADRGAADADRMHGDDPGQVASDTVNTNFDPVTEATLAVDAEANAVEITGDFAIATTDGAFEQNGNVYTITAAGEYVLTGVLAEGQIVVAAGDDDKVTLTLSGTSVTCSTDSPILVTNADKVKIKVADGTYNVVTDARERQTGENDTTGKAAIYAACDMDLLGSGSLVVVAGYNNGIQTKDDLEIKNITLKVTAPNNALKGNDSLTIKSGEITAISTGGDALETDNSDVSSKGNQRGIITISGGNLTLYAANDGIDAAYDVIISGTPNITINTYTYSTYTVKSQMAADSDSYKGIKADNAVTIAGGVIVINAKDDAIHANSDVTLENGEAALGNVTVTGGSITIVSGDDGIHADSTLQIDGGYINVVNAVEGLEGYYVTVNGGETHVYATDDGVNATGANQNAKDGRITVAGGKLYVEVAGRDVDGIDSNGSYTQTGGFVMVCNYNADQSGNMSAVDVNSTVSITGGTIIALGTVPSGGGMGGPGGGPGGRMGMGGMSASSVPTGAVTFSTALSAGSHTFTCGSVSETFTLKKSVSAGWIWTDGITSGNYTLT